MSPALDRPGHGGGFAAGVVYTRIDDTLGSPILVCLLAPLTSDQVVGLGLSAAQNVQGDCCKPSSVGACQDDNA